MWYNTGIVCYILFLFILVLFLIFYFSDNLTVVKMRYFPLLVFLMVFRGDFVFSLLRLARGKFIDCVPLWIGFCTISFQGRKETFQKFKCFLELSCGGVGRNGAKGISRCISFLLANDCFWVLKSDCSSRKGWLVEGCWGICILGGILQVEASAGCSFAWNRFVVYFMLIFLLFLTNVFQFC
jgi:hypothetical protein